MYRNSITTIGSAILVNALRRVKQLVIAWADAALESPRFLLSCLAARVMHDHCAVPQPVAVRPVVALEARGVSASADGWRLGTGSGGGRSRWRVSGGGC